VPPALDEQARDFAGETSALLNATVTNGIRVSALTLPHGISRMGVGLSRSNLKPDVIPMATHASSARVWLFLSHSYQLDDEAKWLMMTRSTYALYASPEMGDANLLLSVDYVRDPVNPYPGAHLHVGGSRDDLTGICDGTADSTKLRDLHLPVGGKRFRPSLEDVLEFVVLEGMADGRPGWQDAIATGRALWEDRQLRAMIRRNQSLAAEQLSDAGWSVVPPA
jgi:hypothetical protein